MHEETSARVTSTGACLLVTSIEEVGSLVMLFECVALSIFTRARWLHIRVDGRRSFVDVEIEIVLVTSRETRFGL
jgi:hypothetical protein